MITMAMLDGLLGMIFDTAATLQTQTAQVYFINEKSNANVTCVEKLFSVSLLTEWSIQWSMQRSSSWATNLEEPTVQMNIKWNVQYLFLTATIS